MTIKITLVCAGEVQSEELWGHTIPNNSAVAFQKFADAFNEGGYTDSELDDLDLNFVKVTDEMVVLTMVDCEGPAVITFESDY